MLVRKISAIAALSVALVTTAVAPVDAGPVAGMTRSLRAAPQTSFIKTSRNTLAPFAFIRFCRDNQSDCQAGDGPSLVEVGQAQRRELALINASVNRAIKPTYDAADDDEWAADVTSGDCEDYALTKRRQLVARGWPSRSLRIAVGKTPQGEGHAVLVVKTSQGDLVLDNRTNSVRPYNQTDLRWEKIQSQDNPRLWLEI